LFEFSASDWQAAALILLKLALGAVLGGVIGYERELHGRPAGIRTHMLIVMGAVLFTELSRSFGQGDPSRIAAQIVTGIGFLGAGTIMRMGPEVKGLTSAASIWAAAAIGMAISAGGPFLIVAVGATALALVTLEVVDHVERRVTPDTRARALRVEIRGPDSIADVFTAIERAGGIVQRVSTVSPSDPNLLHLDVAGHKSHVLVAVSSLPGVRSAVWLD
jgi:putative Mg2+ transporter-C (MgtC) family protein